MQLHTLNDGSPTVAILTPIWDEIDESSWALRQVASVLACGAEVHVLTTRGKRPRSYADGIFSVHELGTIDHEAEFRRDILLGSDGSYPADASLRAEVADSFHRPWSPAADHLARISPAVVVIADHRQLGVFEVVGAIATGAARVVVPMVNAPSNSGRADVRARHRGMRRSDLFHRGGARYLRGGC